MVGSPGRAARPRAGDCRPLLLTGPTGRQGARAERDDPRWRSLQDRQRADARTRQRANVPTRMCPARPGDNPPMTGPCNIAVALPRLARELPDHVAMRAPGRDGRYATALTYARLDARSDAIAA